jgi:hypothetical protein
VFTPLCGLEVRADEVEFRVDAVERPVPDEHHEQDVVPPHPLANRGNRALDVRRRGRLCRILTVLEDRDLFAIHLHPIDEDR